MHSNIESAIARANDLAHRRDYEGALGLANHLIEQYPYEMEVWLLRSYLFELVSNYTQAVEDLTKAIELNSMEPHLYYSLGRYQFLLNDYEEAILSFSKALELCDLHKNDYYREELHFWRAESLLKLKRHQEALEDLREVQDGFTSWTDELRTRQGLLRECGM